VPYCDFTLFYYKQAKLITVRDKPIHKYFYSPSFALLLTPIGSLPYARALVVWTWVQALSLLVLVGSSVLLLESFPRWTHALVLLLTLTCYPVLNNWKWGQANTTFMALVVLALALCERGRRKSAAFALSLVVAARYYPALYALAFIARGRRKTWPWLIGFSTLLLVALPVLAMGALHAWHFYVASAAEIVLHPLQTTFKPTAVVVLFHCTVDAAARADLLDSLLRLSPARADFPRGPVGDVAWALADRRRGCAVLLAAERCTLEFLLLRTAPKRQCVFATRLSVAVEHAASAAGVRACRTAPQPVALMLRASSAAHDFGPKMPSGASPTARMPELNVSPPPQCLAGRS
jgi:hypothetical protein